MKLILELVEIWVLQTVASLHCNEGAVCFIDIVEGDRPGSTYYAAELRGDMDTANRAAEAAGIPVRFVAAQD